MRILSIQWKSYISVLLLGPLQAFIIYRSISTYIQLRYEIINGFLLNYSDLKWSLYLLDFQLFSVIVVMAIFPLWLGFTFFLSSNYFGYGCSLAYSEDGFYSLLVKNVKAIYQRERQLDASNLNSEISNENGRIRWTLFLPMSNFLYMLMATISFLPVPFVKSWMMQKSDLKKEDVIGTELDFLGSNKLIMKTEMTVEYFNLFISLLLIAIQYPKIFWSTNKLFAVTFSISQLLVISNILVDFSVVCIFSKKYLLDFKGHFTLANPTFIIPVSFIGNLILLFSSLPLFQFGYIKCVQSMLKTYRSELSSQVNNSNDMGFQSSASDANITLSNNGIHMQSNYCPVLTGPLLVLFDMALKALSYYGCYEMYLKRCVILYVYILHSSILCGFHLIVWFSICVKQNWDFKVKTSDLSKVTRKFLLESLESLLTKSESNYYQFQRSRQISLSAASNTNLSKASSQNEKLSISHVDKTSSVKSIHSNSESRSCCYDTGSLNQLSNVSKTYKILYANNSMPRPILHDVKDYARTTSYPYYKCSSPYYTQKSMEAAKGDYSFNLQESSIQEEHHSEDESVVTDEVSSINQSPINKSLSNFKSNSSGKFVTFQLDTGANTSIGSSYNSGESLTLISMEPFENVLREINAHSAQMNDKKENFENSLNRTDEVVFTSITNKNNANNFSRV